MDKPQPPKNPSPTLLSILEWIDRHFEEEERIEIELAKEADRQRAAAAPPTGDFITEVLRYTDAPDEDDLGEILEEIDGGE